MNAKQNYKWNELTMGTCYYPEHWDKKLWADDLDRMKKAGISVIRIAEFAWSKVEPEEGVFTYDFFDEFLDLCSEKQMKVIFGTPTATPPAWLTEKYPEVLNARKDGVLLRHGGRRHYNYNSPVYQRLCARVVEREAAHYAKHPAIVGWQIDNELGNSHGDLCMCDSCKARFQQWLEKKYGDIETLNDAWGTAFWSQGYNTFSQISTPLITAVGENPSAMLDWKCFCSDLIVDFAKWQADIIRENCPNHFITHNYMCFDDKVNYYDLGELLDFVSNDIYPAGYWQEQPHQPDSDIAASHDVVRSYKKKPFWIMEQQAGMYSLGS